MENASLDSLVKDFYDYFLGLYEQDGAHDAGFTDPFLAFLPIGMPISPDDLKLRPTDQAPLPELVREWLSLVSNDVPDIDGTSYIPTSRTVDGIYEILLYGSDAAPGANRDLFERIKAGAIRDFDAQIGSMRGMDTFRPVSGSPSNWADPASSGIWTRRTFSSTTRTDIGAPESAKPRRPRPKLEPWQFKVLPKELAPVLRNPRLIDTKLTAHKAQLAGTNRRAGQPVLLDPKRTVTVSGAVHTTSPTKTARLNNAIAINAKLKGATARERVAPVSTTSASKAERVVRFQSSSDRLLQLAEASTPKHSETAKISLSFEYCLVSLRRSWLSQTFLSLPDWYVAGVDAGDYSSGSAGRTDSGDDALLEAIPQAALLVRDLRLEADWSREDRAMISDSAAFGPFSLVGRTLEEHAGSLSCPGMQIAAWVCEPLPMLPPVSAPAPVEA